MSRTLGKRHVIAALQVVILIGSLVGIYLLNDNIDVIKTTSKIRKPTKKNNVFSWTLTCQQNMSAANFTEFQSFPDIVKNFIYYQHCRHFPLLLDIPDKCGIADESAEVFLLLVIKTTPENYDRREVLRKTWAHERLHKGAWIRRIFISGTTDSGYEKKRLNKLLELEQHEYNDILQWDFRDTFYNLTLKQVLFLEWLDINCPNVRFLFNGDDDVFANTDNMVEYLQDLKENNGSTHLFTGNVLENTRPERHPQSKYFVPVQIQKSNMYLPYCSGGGFLLSGYTASVIYNMSHSISLHPIDDVYMGMCLAKAGLKPTPHMGMKLEGLYVPSNKLDGYDPCYYKNILVVHRFFSARMYYLWQRIHDPDLKCGSNRQ